ncbi:12563_t:CDS:2, partial [Racocetra persica]
MDLERKKELEEKRQKLAKLRQQREERKLYSQNTTISEPAYRTDPEKDRKIDEYVKTLLAETKENKVADNINVCEEYSVKKTTEFLRGKFPKLTLTLLNQKENATSSNPWEWL